MTLLRKTPRSIQLVLVAFAIALTVTAIPTIPVFAQNNPPAATPTEPATPQEGTVDSSYTFKPLTQLPGLQEVATSNSLSGFLNQFYKILIGIGAVAAVIMIMYAGVLIMTSSGSVRSNEKAKSYIQNALLGLLLILSPAIVFGIVNPDILKLELNVSDLSSDFKAIDVASLVPGSTQELQCSTIEKIQVANLVEGRDAPGICSALGKGWAAMDNACCDSRNQKVGTKQQCCAYKKSNDQSTTLPVGADPVNGTGRFTLDTYEEDTDYDTGGKCVIQYTNHYDSKEKCNAAAAQFAAKKTLHAASNNCNTDDSKLTSTTIAPILPASSYEQLKKLPPC